MNSNHLTDETLQAYLLQEIEDATIATHLDECSMCRVQLENYRYLIEGIQKVEPETFDFDVTTVVMDKIVHYERKENTKKAFTFWGLLTFLLVGISLFSLPFVPQILRFLYSIPLSTHIFLGGTGLIVLLFSVVDLNKQYKIKEKRIFEKNLQPIP